MTNIQLMLAIGLPMLTVLTGILVHQKGISQLKNLLEARMDSLEKR